MSRAEYKRERNARNRAELIRLLGGTCHGCGTVEPRMIVSLKNQDRPQYGASPRHLDLNGASLRCRLCFSDDHLRPVDHGTTTLYSRGCRCDPCRAAAAAVTKRWRDRQKLARGEELDED